MSTYSRKDNETIIWHHIEKSTPKGLKASLYKSKMVTVLEVGRGRNS